MSVSRNVTVPVGSAGRRDPDEPSCRLMKPTGMMPNRLAALSSRCRARSRASSSSHATRSNRASALRTCASSLIGRRRAPVESM
jgi:hypothetical protein